MGIKAIEKAKIPIQATKAVNNSAAQKPVSENLQELLSNYSKSEKNNFFQEHKKLSVAGGILLGVVGFLAARKLRLVPKNFSGVKEFCSNLFGKSHKKIVAETKSYLAKETEIFYSKTQSVGSIFNFEANKATLDGFLNLHPKKLLITKKEYCGFIDLFKKNGLAKEIDPECITNRKYREIFSMFEKDYNKDWAKAEKIYFSQKGIANPDLAKIKSQISPSKLSFEKEYMEGYCMQKGYTREGVSKMLEESRNLTLESGSLLTKSNYRDEIYDLPFKFASATYNSLARNGNAYIKTEIPKIFKGIKEKELFESLDILSTHIRRSHSSAFPKGSVIKVKIGGKPFSFTSLGRGMEGSVFRIESKGETPVVLKTFFGGTDHSPFGVTFAPSGIYGSLGILREANIAKVVDIPKLYMANPAYIPIKGADSRFMGAWQLTEDATHKSVGSGLKLKDWLSSKKLFCTDHNKADAFVNGVCVDTGFVMNNIAHQYLTYGWGNYGLNCFYSRYLNGETTEQILSLVNKVK